MSQAAASFSTGLCITFKRCYFHSDNGVVFLCAYVADGTDHVQRFKRWFWSIVEKMNNYERQDLVGLSVVCYHKQDFYALHKFTTSPSA